MESAVTALPEIRGRFERWIGMGEGWKAAESVGFVPTVEIVVREHAALGAFQRENVNHGLLPFPSLRNTGRCRMLGIHIEGARHPSSEETKTANRGILAAVCGPIAVSMQNPPCIRCFEKAPRRSLPFDQSGTETQPLQSDVAPTPLSEQYEWPSIPYCVKLRAG